MATSGITYTVTVDVRRFDKAVKVIKKNAWLLNIVQLFPKWSYALLRKLIRVKTTKHT